jgi:LytS/YehU family sensor histidine kinase
MRLFLESSKNKYITLEEEIKLLSLYIELEQMRFEDKFDAVVEVDENLDSHTREIPSILIQPFVENAINHGLFNKKTKGHLRIAFTKKEDESLLCVVEDNGVGRKQAEQLKKDSSRNYKSRGMQIVRERLEVLQGVDDVKINVHVEELAPEALDPGTKVTIEIQDFD